MPKKAKKAQKLVCVPCGKEVIISDMGVSEAVIWCCGKPMKKVAHKSAKKKKAKVSKKKKK